MSQYTGKKTGTQTILGVKLRTIQRIFILALLIVVGLYNSPHLEYEERSPVYPQLKLSVETFPNADNDSPELNQIQQQKRALIAKLNDLDLQKQTVEVKAERLLVEKKLKLYRYLEDNTRQLTVLKAAGHSDERKYENRVQQLKSQIHLLQKGKH